MRYLMLAASLAVATPALAQQPLYSVQAMHDDHTAMMGDVAGMRADHSRMLTEQKQWQDEQGARLARMETKLDHLPTSCPVTK